MNFARLARQNQRTHLPGRAFPMTEPTSGAPWTSRVPCCTTHPDQRVGTTETAAAAGRRRRPAAAAGPSTRSPSRPGTRNRCRTLVAHEPPAAQGLPDRQALLAAGTASARRYQSSRFGPAMAKLIEPRRLPGAGPGRSGTGLAPELAAFGQPAEEEWLGLSRPTPLPPAERQAAESRQVSALPKCGIPAPKCWSRGSPDRRRRTSVVHGAGELPRWLGLSGAHLLRDRGIRCLPWCP